VGGDGFGRLSFGGDVVADRGLFAIVGQLDNVNRATSWNEGWPFLTSAGCQYVFLFQPRYPYSKPYLAVLRRITRRNSCDRAGDVIVLCFGAIEMIDEAMELKKEMCLLKVSSGRRSYSTAIVCSMAAAHQTEVSDVGELNIVTSMSSSIL
jgi:hypothetical protein